MEVAEKHLNTAFLPGESLLREPARAVEAIFPLQ